ncbi:hypothetical protein [Arthrobacter sp.]
MVPLEEVVTRRRTTGPVREGRGRTGFSRFVITDDQDNLAATCT